MSRPPGLPKTGGRSAGAPNRATREFKTYLQGVFRDALFTDPNSRAKLVELVRTLALEPQLLKLLLAYAFGAPSREVDVHHQGQVSLAQLVSGSALEAFAHDEDDDEDDEAPPPAAQDGSPRS